MTGKYQPIRHKIKMTIKDLIAFLDENARVRVIDNTPDRTEATGPDGIIYTGISDHLRSHRPEICAMRVVHVSAQTDDEGRHVISVEAIQSKITFKCNQCKSKFITIADKQMLTHMCPKCGCEMEPEDE